MRASDWSIQDFVERVTGREGLCELTGRQLKIALLIAQGSTDQDIADVLGCSVATVRSEINQIVSKLEANNRAHIAYFVGLRHGVEWCLKHVPQKYNLSPGEKKNGRVELPK